MTMVLGPLLLTLILKSNSEPKKIEIDDILDLLIPKGKLDEIATSIAEKAIDKILKSNLAKYKHRKSFNNSSHRKNQDTEEEVTKIFDYGENLRINVNLSGDQSTDSDGTEDKGKKTESSKEDIGKERNSKTNEEDNPKTIESLESINNNDRNIKDNYFTKGVIFNSKEENKKKKVLVHREGDKKYAFAQSSSYEEFHEAIKLKGKDEDEREADTNAS